MSFRTSLMGLKWLNEKRATMGGVFFNVFAKPLLFYPSSSAAILFTDQLMYKEQNVC